MVVEEEVHLLDYELEDYIVIVALGKVAAERYAELDDCDDDAVAAVVIADFAYVVAVVAVAADLCPN